MKNFKPYLFVLLASTLFSCTGNVPSAIESEESSELSSPEISEIASEEVSEEEPSEEISIEEPSPEPSVEPVSTYKVALESSQSFYDLFSSKTVSIKVDISQDSIAAINRYQLYGNGTLTDLYFPADMVLTMDGKNYNFPEVGIRLKGNTSRGKILDDSGRIAWARHYKISFNETFDDDYFARNAEFKKFYKEWDSETAKENRKDRTLFGLKKLNIKAVPRNNDGCYAREIYSYRVFEENGILSPKSNLVNFTLSNGKSFLEQTYQIVEPIDKTFLKRRFSKNDAKGDLYKCCAKDTGWADLHRAGAVEKNDNLGENELTNGQRVPKGKIGVEDKFHNYVPTYQLKTNDDYGENSDFSKMVNLINGLWNVTYRNLGKDYLESLVNIDYFLKYTAISYLLGNPDDARFNANNYYIYFNPSDGKAYYIPYDYDWVLGLDYSGRAWGYNPFDEVITSDATNPANIYYCTIFKGERGCLPGSYDRTPYQNSYMNYIQSLKTSILDINKFISLTNELYSRPQKEIDETRRFMEDRLSKL